MNKVTIEDINEVREVVINAQTIGDWKTAAQVNLFIVERLWNEVRKLRNNENE